MEQDLDASLHHPRLYQDGRRRAIHPSVEETLGRGRPWLDHGGLGVPGQGPASLVTCQALSEVEHATSSSAQRTCRRECEQPVCLPAGASFRKIITQFGRFLAGRLWQGACMVIAVLTHDIGQGMPWFLGVGMVQAPL